MNVKNITLGKRSQVEITAYFMIPLIWNLQNRQSYSQKADQWSAGVGIQDWLQIGSREFVGGDENELWWWLHNFVNLLKIILYT